MAAAVGVFLARPDDADGFRLSATATTTGASSGGDAAASSTTAEVASMAPVPRSTVRVVVIGTDAAAVVGRLQALGYNAAIMAVDDDAAAGLYARAGSEGSAGLVGNDLARNDPVTPISRSGASERVTEVADVLLVLGS